MKRGVCAAHVGVFKRGRLTVPSASQREHQRMRNRQQPPLLGTVLEMYSSAGLFDPSREQVTHSIAAVDATAPSRGSTS